jgi:hypothetical protein
VRLNLRMLMICLTVLVTLAPVASGYITVDMPLIKIYNSADLLYVAKVKSVEEPQQRVIITLERVLRQGRKNSAAAPPTEDFALQLDEPKDLLKQVVKGMPVVIFVGKQAAAIHLADEWLIAQQATPRVWRIHGKHELTSSFPGRTAALVKIVESLHKKQPVLTKGRDSYTAEQLKALGDPLLDMFEHSNWGAFHSLGKLGVNGTHMIAGDVNGDKKPDVLVATSRGVRFYLGGGSAAPVAEATKEWGLANALASQAAFGDVDGDGKLDLLLDATLWLNTGSSFVEAKKALTPLEKAQPLAVGLTDINADKKPDALILHKNGRLQVFENAGRTDQPWKMQVRQLWSKDELPLAAHFGPFGDNGKLHVMVIWPNDIVRYGLHDDSGPPMDYRRLTGRTREARYFPIKDYAASAPVDLNGGDGRLDLFIATRQGKPRDICLMNRGHGAFWPNNEAGRPKGLMKKNVFPAAMTAADMRGSGSWEMLVLTSAGELFQIDSPPYKKGKPAK